MPALVLALLFLSLAACGGDDEPEDGAGEPVEGTVAVRLEETEGILIEGFEVGLRFESAGGEEVRNLLWSDFVATLESADIDAYYDSVLEQPVIAGPVRVSADVSIGIGPGPEPPDLQADRLPCELELDVPAGETVTVEVRFDDAAPDCLRQV